MDHSIYAATAPGRVANSTAYSLGTHFQLYPHGNPLWLTALRFYRPSTGVFGTITGGFFDDNAVLVAGTQVSITLPQGSGATGWITLPLTAPVPLPRDGANYYAVFHFPGGSGNGYPQLVPPLRWDLGNSFRSGPVYSYLFWSSPDTGRHGSAFVAGPSLAFPTQLSQAYHGGDVVITDTDPNPTAQSGPEWTLWGPSGPPGQVAVTPGNPQAVVGLEFAPAQDVWVTSLRVYRPQQWGARVANPDLSQNFIPDMRLNDPTSPTLGSATTAALYEVVSATEGNLVSGTEVTVPGDVNQLTSAAGWREVYLPGAVRLTPGQRYRVAFGLPGGRATAPQYFSTGAGAAGVAVGPLSVPPTSAAIGGATTSLIAGTSTVAFPTTASSDNAYLDVTVTSENPNAPGEPQNPVRLWGVQNPTTTYQTSTFEIGIGSRTVGLEFTASTACTAYGLRYYRHQGISAVAGRLYAVSVDSDDPVTQAVTGTEVTGSQVSFPAANSDGWKFAPFTAPVRLAAGQRYRIAVRFPAGYIYTSNFFGVGGAGAGGVTTGILFAPGTDTAAGMDNGSYSLPDAFPDQTFGGSNPWIDVTVAAGGDTPTGAAGVAAEPSAALRLWGTDPPASVAVGRAHTRVVGLEFMVERDATVHGYRFYRPDVTVGGPVQARLYAVGDGEHGTEVVGADTTFSLDTTSTGWMWAPLRRALALVGGRRYKLVVFFPDGYPTTPDWYVDGQPAADIDQRVGLLRGFAVTNATRNAQPTEAVGGTQSDAVIYPSLVATDNPWIDVTVTDGVEGADASGEEPAGVMRAWGAGDPTGGNITQASGPEVVAHQFTLSAPATLYGLRMWRPDLRQQTTTARLYRVDTETSVGGTAVTFPPSTARGWVYAPLSAPVGLETGVAYRVAVLHPVLGPGSPNELTAPVNAGVITTVSAWTADSGELIYPHTASNNNYWLDVAVTPATGTVVPEDSLTLFPGTPDATVSVRADYAQTVGTTFAGQREDRFTTAELPYWVKAIRFYRPSTAVTGTITGRIYDAVASGQGVPIPGTDVVFTLSGTGWHTAELPYPVRLSQLPWYRVAVHFPNGYPVTPNYFTTGPGGTARFGPQGIVYTPAYGYTGSDGIQGSYVVGASLAYPNKGTANDPVHGENYWVDVVATTSPPTTAAPALPRFPLSYSQFGQISSTTVILGTTFTFAQVAYDHIYGPRSVGLEFTADLPCFLHAYRFPRLSTTIQARPVSARLYRVTGPDSGVPVPGTDVTFTMSADYWQSGYLDTPLPLVVGQRYKAVFLFLDATPIGVGHDDVVDRARGPLRVFANSKATGGATATMTEATALTYPSAPAAAPAGTPVVDVWVSATNPTDALPSVRSVFDNRRPALIQYLGWPTDNSVVMPDGTIVNPPEPPIGYTAGMEFYVTTETCFLRGFRYWRAPYPAVTQLTEMRLYRVTGTQPGHYYPDIDADYDVTTGELVPGTSVLESEWAADPNQPDSYAEGWVTLTLPAPVPLQPGQRYKAAAWYPRIIGNRYAPATPSRPETDFYWDTGPGAAGHVDGPLIAPGSADATAGTQGSDETRYDYMAYPNTGIRTNGFQFWIDVEVLDTAPRNVDGGVVTVTIPPLAEDPRKGGYRAYSVVNAYLAVTASATTARHTATDPLAAPLDVTATGIGGRDLVEVDVNVQPAGGGSKGAAGSMTYTLAMWGRQAATRPKGVADSVTTEVIPTVRGESSIPWSAMPRPPDTFEWRVDATELRFIAQNIMTRQFVHWDLPIVEPTLTWRLSGPFELSGSLNPAYIDLLDIGIDEWATFIHIELQGYILGTGILMPWSAQGEELTIDAVGITTYPHGIPYLEVYEEFFPDIMMVVRELWRHIQSFPNGNMGVQLPTGYMGVPLYGDSVYDSQTGEFLGWKKWSLLWTDFVDCGTLIDELASSTPFDYIEVHQWNPTHTDVLHGINFYYPRAGGKRLELRFAEGENIVEAVPITEPDDAYASDIILKGAGEGYNQVFAWVSAVVWDRLRRVTVLTDEQVQTVEVAQGMGFQELVRRLYLRGVDKLVVEAFHPLAPFGSYNVGDDILVEGMIPWVGEFGLWHRVLSMALEPESGLVTLELQRSEAFRYGREITYSK